MSSNDAAVCHVSILIIKKIELQNFCNNKCRFFQIYDKLSAKTGFIGKFVTNEAVSLHGFQPVLFSTKDAPTKYANTEEINVIHVSENFILDDEILRSLVAESCNIFYNLQSLKSKSNDLFLQTSRVYRSAIRATLNKLQEAIIDDSGENDIKTYESYITIFYSIECLWHLCEFLLIDRSTMSVVPNLLEWVRIKIISVVSQMY